MNEFQRQSIQTARALVDLGVPVFRATKCPGQTCQRPGCDGDMHLPKNWQRQGAAYGPVDAWRPGDGLAAVMGHQYDAIDIDTRNGGDLALANSIQHYGLQNTPRVGVHLLIPALGVGKHQSILPGVDLQGGKPDGSSRGFIWIAPTVRYGKAYSWSTLPQQPHAYEGDSSDWDWIVQLAQPSESPPEASEPTEASSDPPPATYVARFYAEDLPAYVSAEPGTGDTRLWQLVRRAYEFVNAGWVDRDEVLDALNQAREDRARQHPYGGGQDDSDWARILRSAKTKRAAVRSEGLKVGGVAVDPPGKAPAPTGSDSEPTADAPAEDDGWITADLVKLKRVRWLRHNRIPLGEITLVAGREGTGKSTYLAHVAAKITQGGLEGEFFGEPKGVLYVANEDSLAHTVVPRLVAAGADLTRVSLLRTEDKRGLVLPGDVSRIAARCQKVGAGAVMLDPVISLVDPVLSTDRARELRQALEPLRKAAEEVDAAVMALVHFNKNDGDVLTKIAGSRGWVEVARAVLGIARDDENEQVVMSQVKNNLGKMDMAHWAYKIEGHVIEIPGEEEPAETGRLEWIGKVETSVADLLGKKPEGPGRPRKSDPEAVAARLIDLHDRMGRMVTRSEALEALDMAPATFDRYVAIAKGSGLIVSTRAGYGPPGGGYVAISRAGGQ